MIPEELKEHNAVLERVRTGGQISFVTRRCRDDGTLLDPANRHQRTAGPRRWVIGWVNVCHPTVAGGSQISLG